MIIVYRPQYSAKHPVTVRTFMDEFSNYLESAIITPNKLLIGGDFNIHVNDQSDVTAKALLDLLQNYDLINCLATYSCSWPFIRPDHYKK